MKLLGNLSGSKQTKQEKEETLSQEEAMGDAGEDMLTDAGEEVLSEAVDNVEVVEETGKEKAEENLEQAKAEESLDLAEKNTQIEKDNSAVETIKDENASGSEIKQSGSASDDDKISAKLEDEIEDTVSVASNSVSNKILQARLAKEQSRSKNKEMLLEIVNNKNATKQQKKDASDQLLRLSDYMEKESSVQEILCAKGYQDCLVSVSEDSCDVAVKKEQLTEVDRAKIEDVVKRKTGMSMEKIVISSYSE